MNKDHIIRKLVNFTKDLDRFKKLSKEFMDNTVYLSKSSYDDMIRNRKITFELERLMDLLGPPYLYTPFGILGRMLSVRSQYDSHFKNNDDE